MDITISPHRLSGQIDAIPSKSQAHRLLICAAFADRPTELICPASNQDIEATVRCLNALGANIISVKGGYLVHPITKTPDCAFLDCGESGSTLRFLLPVVGALGVNATFLLSGRLPLRPLSPLWEELERMGCHLSRPSATTIYCTGKLAAGDFQIDGSVSSQYITGLMYAISLLPGKSCLTITGKTESRHYIEMTLSALQLFGVQIKDFSIEDPTVFRSPGKIRVEGDWSNSAFFLAAQALCNQVAVIGLNPDSPQGDRVVLDILHKLEEKAIIDAADIPDLVPILAVVAGAKKGAIFQNIGRLRLKESDRVASTAAMLNALGAEVSVTGNSMEVFPAPYHGCTIQSENDHRIAMAGAIAATAASGPVTISGAQCVAKSYPDFWKDYRKLGGHYVEHIR